MDANTSATNTPQPSEEPKKFVRTFSSDLLLSKEGKVPGFVPFVESPESTGARSAGASVPVPAPARPQESGQAFSSFHDLPEEAKVAFEKKIQQSPAVHADHHPSDEYVRTFKGDMTAVKKGNVPGFSLFKKAPAIREHLTAGQSDASVVVNEPFFTQAPIVSARSPVAEGAPTPAERLVAGSPISETPDIILPKEEVVASVSSAPSTPHTPAIVKTYASDFSEKVKETNATPITILAAEQDLATSESRMASQKTPVSLGSHLYILGGIVLLALSGGGAYAAYTHYAGTMRPVLFDFSVSAPIFVDDREEIAGTKSVLMDAIAASVSRPITSGSVRMLYTASSTKNNESVFSALQLPTPDILRRNLRVPGSMAGVVRVGDSQSPFFVLSVDSYAETFSGMLTWEPDMQNHLKKLYPLASLQEPATTATSSLVVAATTSAQRVRTATRLGAPSAKAKISKFADEVVANHDVRVYRDADGRGVLVYGYWDPETLIIARDTVAFTELLQRLATSRSR